MQHVSKIDGVVKGARKTQLAMAGSAAIYKQCRESKSRENRNQSRRNQQEGTIDSETHASCFEHIILWTVCSGGVSILAFGTFAILLQQTQTLPILRSANGKRASLYEGDWIGET